MQSHSRPGPSLTRGPDASRSGDSVESLCELALENALSFGSVSAMSERASLASTSGWMKIQSSARSRLLFWKHVLSLKHKFLVNQTQNVSNVSILREHFDIYQFQMFRCFASEDNLYICCFEHVLYEVSSSIFLGKSSAAQKLMHNMTEAALSVNKY